MTHIRTSKALIIGALLTNPVMSPAQTQQVRETFSIAGYPGNARVMRAQGRALIDLEDLARITKGSLAFEGSRITLTLSSETPSSSSNDAINTGFSRPFMKAAIEAMATIREWGGMLQVIVQNGYPVGKAMAGTTIRAYQGRAADAVALAAAAASNDSDSRGLELLRNELNNVQTWSESFVEARNAMRAVDLTTSEHPLEQDEEAQKIISCGQFLAQMFASGTFQDDVTCH